MKNVIAQTKRHVKYYFDMPFLFSDNNGYIYKTKKFIMKIQLNFFLLVFAIVLFFSCENPTSEKTPEPTLPVPPSITMEKDASTTEKINRFLPEIQKFDSLDQVNGLTNNGILFTGSSSIRMWSTLTEDMSPLPVLNRGFGGSTIPEVLHFSGKYLFQHKPQIVVLYCGENDISEGQTPETVLASFKTFAKILETRLPNSKLVFISMKPSVARWNLWEQYKTGNALIQKFISGKPNMLYVDAGETMLASDGKIKEDIFIEDGLHMNAKGYEGWTQQMKPILESIYKKN